jgi:peptidase M48-like protein
MKKISPPSILLTLALVLGYGIPVHTQTQCGPPTITARVDTRNIFSPEQEMILGELTYQNMANDVRIVRDPELTAYINRIGDRLIKHLPPTGLKLRFFIMDIPDANAFDVPGGYIFISRKLIGFVASEDELAGVMAHELGHAVVRHGAIDFSQALKRVLNVSAVGDRKDIAEKYNLLIERWRTKSGSRSDNEEDEQLEADHIGVYATIAAGYDPKALEQFYSRLVETKTKSGNWFSDIFGRPNPDEKRLREMAKISDQLPAECREAHQANASDVFLKWQADVVSYRGNNLPEDLKGLLWKKELTPKLRSDISHFAFSPDGKYFLAQDDSAVTVVQREPLEVALQITAPDADDASFTPDGKSVVFGTENLRYEKWDIAQKKPVQVRELVVRRDCWEHAFSPDGNFLVCFDHGLNLNVINTQTGQKVFEKKDFYRLTLFEYWFWLAAGDEAGTRRFFNIEFSPDSKVLLIARNNKHRMRFSIDFETVDSSDDTVLALDTTTMKPVKTGGDLKRVTRRPFVFIDSNRVLGMASAKPEDSGTFSFPDGKRIAKVLFGANEIKRTANPNYVVVKPLRNAKMGIFDLSKNLIVSGSNKADAAMWDNLLVYESASGEVLLSETHFDAEQKILNATPVKTIAIPVAEVGDLTAADISDNLQWLTVSTRSRGALWNLTSGDRKLFVRGFRGALVADDGGGIGDFPKLDDLNHSLVLLNPLTSQATPFREISEKGARQYGGFVLVRRGLKEAKKKEDNKADNQTADEGSDETSLGSEVRFELKSAINDKVVWSRDFPKEAPDFFFDPISGRMILYWTLGSEEGKGMLKSNPGLAAKAKALGNKDDDYLMEIVDAFAAKTIGTLLLETGKGSFSIGDGFSDGNWVVLRDNDNRVLVYSIKDGDLRHRFFGTKARINPARNQIVVENYPGELTFYDLETGDSQARLNFNASAAFIKFTLDGKKLFVLSNQQNAYAFDVDKLSAKSVQASN